ncbi:DUF92 domain-containing protein [Granulicella arctica]|uniref:DUF92 domain-containing protein n=1 Tax=Granulicella arctica TaxID=940613 RepID=UPI0021E03EC8|nr:DUF92 domain-containing protein [Granulicella arctica]
MGSKMHGDRLRAATGKTISAWRDRMQSELLTGAVGGLLVVKAVAIVIAMHRLGGYPPWLWWSCGASAAFALLVWLLRSATGAAAMIGGVICLNILLAQNAGRSWAETAMPALLSLFLLTFAATRFGRRHKEKLGLAEPKRGRRASQVLANLGVAGLFAGAASPLLFAACLAALAEATADTVSSEMGQVVGGRTLLLTTWSEVPVGTDGGISIAGTTLGAAGAGIVVLVTAAVGWLPWAMGLVVFGAGVAGLLFDSYLGATVERRGWLGNDLVNFCSTLFAAALAYVGMRLL